MESRITFLYLTDFCGSFANENNDLTFLKGDELKSYDYEVTMLYNYVACMTSCIKDLGFGQKSHVHVLS